MKSPRGRAAVNASDAPQAISRATDVLLGRRSRAVTRESEYLHRACFSTRTWKSEQMCLFGMCLCFSCWGMYPAAYYFCRYIMVYIGKGMSMNINWFKDPDHLVYINAEKSLAELEKRLKLPGLVQAADMLRAAPNAEGITIKGSKRSSGKLFIPDLVFKQHIEMGENLFLYLGEMSECYVIYYPQQPVCTEE